MTRIRGLPNERYRERREAFERTLKKLYDGDVAEPIPPEWLAMLDRIAK